MKSKVLLGKLKDFNFLKILLYLYRDQKTGLLTISRDLITKKIFFRNGVPSSARSNLKSELLGEFLVAHGAISQEKQEQALEIQESRKISFAAALI